MTPPWQWYSTVCRAATPYSIGYHYHCSNKLPARSTEIFFFCCLNFYSGLYRRSPRLRRPRASLLRLAPRCRPWTVGPRRQLLLLISHCQWCRTIDPNNNVSCPHPNPILPLPASNEVMNTYYWSCLTIILCSNIECLADTHKYAKYT